MATSDARRHELRQRLLARRRELVATLHDRIRFVRAERTATLTGGEIASARLRALPFAVRCRDCEVRRETERARPTQVYW